MKNIKLILLFIFLGLFEYSNAQVCKISESGDNVEVFSAIIEGNNTVVVTVGNDSQDISANVTVTVEVGYQSKGNSYTIKRTYEGKKIAQPNTETVIKIKIKEEINGDMKPTSVKVMKIEGTKCM